MRRVWPACTALAGWSLRNICLARARLLPNALAFGAYAAADRGDTREAIALADLFLDAAHRASPDVCWWHFVNSACDIYVNGGRYAKALAAAERWSAAAQARGSVEGPLEHAYAMINRAEALHNVGEHEAALRLLAQTEAQARDRLSREGLALLRAWILAHVDGRAQEAWAELSIIDGRVFGPRYRAEYHFTRAVALCELGRLADAEQEARDGARVARRAASRRNALHVAARVALAANDDARAIELLESARGLAYRAQAAPDLIRLGDAYQRAGKPAEARRAYADALDTDPESAACAVAASNLTVLEATGA